MYHSVTGSRDIDYTEALIGQQIHHLTLVHLVSRLLTLNLNLVMHVYYDVTKYLEAKTKFTIDNYPKYSVDGSTFVVSVSHSVL